MNGVVAMADLLADTDLDEEQQLFVDTIRSSGQALLNLINDVLDYSKIEAQKLTLRPELFDLERIIHEVALMLQPTALQKGLRLLVDFDMFMPSKFYVDPGRVRQILTNLIGNAIKFTTEGHVLVRAIGLPSGEAEGDYRVHITVEDTGIGIPPDLIGHIFGEFNQVEDDRNRRFEGTGLGLAISEKLVKLMDGEIWVDSELGIGSSFGFYLTLKAADHAEIETIEKPDWITRVILADANELNRQIMEKHIAAWNIEIAQFSTGSDIAAQDLPQNAVALLDQRLGDISGADLAKSMRQGGFKGPILLMVTNPVNDPDTKEAITRQIQKPTRRQEIQKALAGLDRPQIPIAPPDPELSETDPAAPVAARQMRILTAEDNKTNRLVFAKTVKKLDIDLVFATNGREALEKFQSFQPDLVFMDVSMPEMDGKEATRKIREFEAQNGLERTPIVALTAHAMPGDDVEILQSGMDHYMTKPLSKPLLFERIAEAQPKDCRDAFPLDPPQAAAS